MPSKKSSQQSAVASSQGAQQGGGGVRPPSPVLLSEGMDPVLVLLGIIDKKTRNLEKRKQRLTALEESLISGKALDKDQKEAVTKLSNVSVQLDLARDFQKQFQGVQAEYLKLQKKKQKQEKIQQKEAELEAVKSAVSYVLRIENLLVSMDDVSRENFRNGVDGAEHLSEAELMQIDEFYHLINPPREDNPRYLEKIDQASEHLMLLYDQSSKPVVNTTYAALHDVLKRVDECGYFDKAPQPTDCTEPEDDDDDSDMGENELVEPEPLAETAVSPVATTGYEVYDDEAGDMTAVPEAEESDELLVSSQSQVVQAPPPQSPTVQQLTPVQTFVEEVAVASDPIESFPSKVAPPPDFAGLQAGLGGGDLGCIDGFSFMRDSTVPEVGPSEEVLVTAPPPDRYGVLPARTAMHRLPVAVSPPSSQQPAPIEPPVPLDEVTVNGQTPSAPISQNYSQERQPPLGGYHGKSSHRGYGGPRGGHGGPRNNPGYSNSRRNQPGGGGGGGTRYNGQKSLPQRGRPNYRQHNPVRNK